MTRPKLKTIFHRNKQAAPSVAAPTAVPKALPTETTDLWEIAYQNINSTDPSVIRNYEQIILDNVRSSYHGERSKKSRPSTQDYGSKTPTRRDFQEVVATKLEEFQQKHQQDASSLLQQGIEIVKRVQGPITMAASQEPHAAIAWAAVSLLLPILLQPSEQHENAIKIMNLTTDVIRRYGVKEEQLRSRLNSAMKEDLQLQLRTRILELYTLILRIQMRAVCQFSRSNFHQYARDVFQADDWYNLQDAVKQQDVACQALEYDLNASIQRRELLQKHRQWVLERLDYVEEAAYDAVAEGTESRRSCQEGTRVDLLSRIRSWATDDSQTPIFWLQGMAGTGKTTIARTIAEELADSQAVASFFIRRNHEQLVSVRKLISTIAYQLAHQDDEFCEALRESLEQHPSLGRSTTELSKQYQKLIIDPLEKRCRGQRQVSTLFILLDALDECDESKNLLSILDMLSNPKYHLPELHVRIFITSRAEPLIVQEFAHMPEDLIDELVLHHVDQEQVDHDIELFLHARLREIQRMRDLPLKWPSTIQVHDIVKQAGQLFIFAETVCRFVDVDPRDEDPCSRLDQLCKGASPESTAFSALDSMYRLALVAALRGVRATKRSKVTSIQHSVVGRLILLFDKLSLVELDALIRIDKSPTQLTIKDVVGPLSSLFNVPTTPQLPVTILHESFRDFLTDKCRSDGEPSLWVSKPETHRCLLDDCLDLMSRQLRKNILSFASPGTKNEDIARTGELEAIPPGLRYACRFWILHAEKAELRIKDWRRVEEFMKQYLLNWLEAMSLFNEIYKAVQQLDQLRTNCEQSLVSLQTLKRESLESNSEPESISPLLSLQDFLEDANCFTRHFQSIIAQAPLQVYYGALMFAPTDNLVRLTFHRELMLKPAVVIQQYAVLDSCHLPPEGHHPNINEVVFSHDGLLVASASRDWTIQLWNAKTGEAGHTLKGHTSGVNVVVFSHDGSLLVSGSRDSSVRLWDVKTGKLRYTFVGHISGVSSVVFSHDRSLIVSASCDCTVRLWDTETGEARYTLEGHTMQLTSAVFSPDESLIASASYDGTVRLWDAKRGEALYTFEGHTASIHTVVFSHDGSLVASASYDQTARLWDTKTGEARYTLEGHTAMVYKVVFSYDGSLIATASKDSTVRLWDTLTGKEHFLKKVSGHDPRIQFDKTEQHLYIEGERVDFAFGPSPLNIELMVSNAERESKHRITLDESGEWLLRNEARFIWIPYKFQGICKAQDGVVVVGSTYGHVTFFIEDYDDSRYTKDETPLCDSSQMHSQLPSADVSKISLWELLSRPLNNQSAAFRLFE